jgi:hypothetical protein
MLHDEIGSMFFHIEIKSMIFDDIGVSKMPDAEEIAFEFKYMFLIHGDDFHGIDFASEKILAGVYYSVGSFSNFLSQSVFLIE